MFEVINNNQTMDCLVCTIKAKLFFNNVYVINFSWWYVYRQKKCDLKREKKSLIHIKKSKFC